VEQVQGAAREVRNAAQPDSVPPRTGETRCAIRRAWTYKLDDRMKLRAGVAYDQTPVPDDGHRTVRLPDNKPGPGLRLG